MIYIYNAGPLFTEYEVKQRKEEGKILRDMLGSTESTVANPIDLPVNPSDENGGMQPVPSEIFEADSIHIDKANVFFFDLANNDPGTLVELGMAVQRIRAGETDIKIYAVHSDFRGPSNARKGFESTIGFNSFMTGALFRYDFEIYTSFKDAAEAFRKDFNL